MDPNEEAIVLLCDDDPQQLSILSDILSRSGFDVAVATNGARAVQLAKEGVPDLILLDIRMEGIDGFETCRRLKLDPITVDIPVIFMTASSEMSTDKVKALRLGAVDYVYKPLQAEELLARVQVHTKLRRAMKSLASQVKERLTAEAALHKLTHELENRVAERTAELERANEALKEAHAALRTSNAQLESDIANHTEELRQANERLTAELAERAKAEVERARLQEEVIHAQNTLLAKLSTPVIPITDEIMVMPLIGTIDVRRANQALQAALTGVQASRARVVILDVTGVTVIDSAVAATLVSAATALRLLGASAIITGLSPRLAHTLVDLGVDLSGVVTTGTLKSGIDYALRQGGGTRSYR